MKNSTISAREIDLKISKVCLKTLSLMNKKENQSKSTSPYNPLASDELPVGEKFFSKKYKDLLGYLILIHFYPVDEKHYFYLVIDFQDHVRNLESQWLSVLLNKELFLQWLEIQQTITEQVFFSTIANPKNLIRLMSTIVIQFEKELVLPKRVIRRKGYKDKGTLPDYSTSIIKREISVDVWISLEQFLIEEKREIQLKENLLLADFLTGTSQLSPELMVKFKIIKE